MTNEIKIAIPEGMVIDSENSDLVNGVIKFKEKPHVQKKWEDFGTVNGYEISSCEVIALISNAKSDQYTKNVYPTKSLAEAAQALCQLFQWRNKVWKEDNNWEPDWESQSEKYCIDAFSYEIQPSSWIRYSRVLSFRTPEIRDQFLKDHRDLIEIAKEVL